MITAMAPFARKGVLSKPVHFKGPASRLEGTKGENQQHLPIGVSNAIVDALGPVSLVGGTAAIYTSLLNHPSSTLTHLSFAFMMLLAVQYALQPRLSRKYIPPQVNKQSVAMVEEVVKTGIAAAIFCLKPRDIIQSSLQGTNEYPKLHD